MPAPDATIVDRAAELLVQARKAKTRIANIPPEFRPSDIETALAVQQRVLELLGEKPGGWKCGLQSKPGVVMLAPIPLSSVYRTSPVPVVGNLGKIEPEIAFVLAGDILPRSTPYTDAEIRGFVGDIRFVLELLGPRFANTADVTYPEVLADAYNNYGLFVGPSIPDALSHALETQHVKVGGPDGVIVDREGKHPSGHPMNSFSWLINYQSSRGQTMHAGEIVTTGSYAGIVEVPLGVPIRVTLGSLSSLDVTLVSA